jgi:hypothetical protein
VKRVLKGFLGFCVAAFFIICLLFCKFFRVLFSGTSGHTTHSLQSESGNTEKKDSPITRATILLINITAGFLLGAAVILTPPTPLLSAIIKWWLIGQAVLLPCLVIFETIRKMDSYKHDFGDSVDGKSDTEKPTPSSGERKPAKTIENKGENE